MEDLGKLYKKFCKERCVHKDDSELWHKLQPCLDCPVESFVEFVAE